MVIWYYFRIGGATFCLPQTSMLSLCDMVRRGARKQFSVLALRVFFIPYEVEESLRTMPFAISTHTPEGAEAEHIKVDVRDKKVYLTSGKQQICHPKEVFSW